ncbi:hypothetical protein [Psychrobacter glacincola]|uniref:hypothetical protein n=1 Tax=Psychrobacter glacincola TaxID=56810 RepID=UPI0039B103E9
MKRLAMIVASSTLAIGAQAANWSTVAESQTGSIFSLDLDSIERSDINILDEKQVDNITVAIRRAYPAPKSVASDSKESGIHHSDQQWLISCKDASYYRRAYVYYTADNKVIKSWQSDKPLLTSRDFKITSPKTVSRILTEQACKNYEQAKTK